VMQTDLSSCCLARPTKESDLSLPGAPNRVGSFLGHLRLASTLVMGRPAAGRLISPDLHALSRLAENRRRGR
jgi:hypothetical protein